jgi:hypothetical protein
MKFATQISPLLNLKKVKTIFREARWYFTLQNDQA